MEGKTKGKKARGKRKGGETRGGERAGDRYWGRSLCEAVVARLRERKGGDLEVGNRAALIANT